VGVYLYQNGQRNKLTILPGKAIQSLSASAENLLMIQDSTLWTENISGQLQQIADDLIRIPLIAFQDSQGVFWVGDKISGLVSNSGGAFTAYRPDGPSTSSVFRMVYDNDQLFVLAGGYSSTAAPLNRPGDINIFENGTWRVSEKPFADVTDLAFSAEETYISTFGSGLKITDDAGNITTFDESNSPLVNTGTGKTMIPAIEYSADGVWVANYGADQSLHLLKKDHSWESLSFNFPNAQNPIDLSVDGQGNVWIALNPATGGGLISYQPQENLMFYKTDVVGSGALPDKSVNCLVTDRDGYTWIGTNAGVAFLFAPDDDAIKPVFENRFLLRDEKITSIEVDGGNRKWIGTGQGVWLFSATGEELVFNFTVENSPLPSNLIQDIEINDRTGEVFFATDKGIVSYQGDATVSGEQFQKIKIFPNPVTPGFTGTVGISGLAQDAFVKITDISGNLIWQSRANGGTATWNVKDYRGKRARTGVYLVFAANQDGTETAVGKIAVIE
jgi:hypothetical protein